MNNYQLAYNPLLKKGLQYVSTPTTTSAGVTSGTISVSTTSNVEYSAITQSAAIYFKLTGEAPYIKKYIVDGNGSGIYFDNDIIVNGTINASLRNHITFYVGANGVKYADILVSELGEVVVPTLSSAEIGTVGVNDLILTFSEALNISNPPAVSAFAVLVNGVANVVTSVVMYFSNSKLKVKLILTTAVVSGDTVTVAYTKPGLFNLRDLAGNEVANF